MSVIAIIPARGGSKGIPQKNMHIVGNQPLISYSIEQALAAERVDRVVVSTDDDQIAAYARALGALAIMRPDDISGDHAQIEDAMIQVYNELPVDSDTSRYGDIFVLLQPTSPLRRTHDIDGAINHLYNGEFDSVFSATPIFPYVWLPTVEGGTPEDYPMERAFWPHTNDRLSRQDRRPLLQENGSIYVTKADSLITEGNRLAGKIGYYRMPPWMSIEIDTLYDVAQAEVAMIMYAEALA